MNNTMTTTTDTMSAIVQNLKEATTALSGLMATTAPATRRAPRASFPSNQKILAHLQKQGSITPMEALMNFGLFRLAASIHDLRNAGHDIRTDIRTDSAGKHYARYYLNY